MSEDFYKKVTDAMAELGRQVHSAVDSELITLHQKAEAAIAQLAELEARYEKYEQRKTKSELEAKVDEMTARRFKDIKNPKSIKVRTEDVREDVKEEDQITDEDDVEEEIGLKAFTDLLAASQGRSSNDYQAQTVVSDADMPTMDKAFAELHGLNSIVKKQRGEEFVG